MIKSSRWIDSHRPPSVAYMILPPTEKYERLRKISLGEFELPNLILYSHFAGTGKSTFLKAIAKDLGLESKYFNVSECGGIDTLRTKVLGYAKTCSLNGKLKLIQLDEIDGASIPFQKALRSLIEEVQNNCRFILTCNYIDSIIEPLQSRCELFDFNHTTYKEAMLPMIAKLSAQILRKHEVRFEDEAVVELCNVNFPDFRQTIKELQRMSEEHGAIDSLSIENYDTQVSELIDFLKGKKVMSVMNWYKSKGLDPSRLYRLIYQGAMEQFKPMYLPNIIACISDFIDKSAKSFDKEITFHNFVLQIIPIIAEAETKD